MPDDSEVVRPGGMTDEALATAAVRLATGRARMQPADRDDALQDARLAIWQAHDLYDGRGSFEPFALTRARWAVIDGLRRRHGRTGFARGTQTTTDDLAWVPDHHPGPERTAVASDTCARTVAAIAALSPRQRALVTAAVEGCPQARVAERWGVTQGAVSRDLALARRKLRGAA